MKQYLVETKTESHLIDADIYGTRDIKDGRCAVYEFYRSSGVLVATFNASDVKAVIEQQVNVMARALQCDRCGNLYMSPTDNRRFTVYGKNRIDFCEICYKEFENFMLKYKESDNGKN